MLLRFHKFVAVRLTGFEHMFMIFDQNFIKKQLKSKCMSLYCNLQCTDRGLNDCRRGCFR